MEKLLRRLKSLQEKSGNQLTCEELARKVGKNIAVVDNSPSHYEIIGNIDNKRHLLVITKDHDCLSYPRNGGGWRGGIVGGTSYKEGELIIASFSIDAYYTSTFACFSVR